MHRNKLYLLLSTACLAGYVWVANAYFTSSAGDSNQIGVCIFKQATGIPCPSCGSTRAVLLLLKGNFTESLLQNPFGLLILAIMVITPFWILYDLTKNKFSLLNFYNHIEYSLKRKWLAIPAILLVLANWMWNIYKDL